MIASSPRRRRFRVRWGKVGYWVAAIATIAFVLFPFYWQINTSLKPQTILHAVPTHWWPGAHPHWGNYLDVFRLHPFARYLLNSLVVSVVTTLLALLFAAFAGYALGRLHFRGKSPTLFVVLAVSMFPPIAIISPLYIMFYQANLLNSYPGLIIPYLTFALPLAVWNLTNFFRQIPKEMEEAAFVDGAGRLRAFGQVVLPLAGPGMFTTAILTFIQAWNEYMIALTFNTADQWRTVPPGIAMFQGQFVIPWDQISAASVIVTIPLVILVLILQRRIVAGLTAGAVKG